MHAVDEGITKANYDISISNTELWNLVTVTDLWRGTYKKWASKNGQSRTPTDCLSMYTWKKETLNLSMDRILNYLGPKILSESMK